MTVTKYIWDVESDNVLMETDENDVTSAVYNHEPGEFGELISQRRNGKTSYYEFDATGSTRALTDEAGNRTDTYIYSGFGETIAKTGTTTNPYRYVGARGYYFDEETEDYYVRARTYNPVVGRWISRDPLGLSIDGPEVAYSHGYVADWKQAVLKSYAYVVNNPANIIDASGLEEMGENSPNIKCTIELVCNVVGYILRFKHCGIKVIGCGVNKEYHAGGGSSISIGNPTTCDVAGHKLGVSEDDHSGWIAATWTFNNCSVCKCIKTTVGIVNKVSDWNYDYLPANDPCGDDSKHCNSSYIAKCLLRKCRVDLAKIDFGWSGKPVGWDHRVKKCVDSSVSFQPGTGTLVGKDCCSCNKWVTTDTSWCGPS